MHLLCAYVGVWAGYRWLFVWAAFGWKLFTRWGPLGTHYWTAWSSTAVHCSDGQILIGIFHKEG